MNTYDYRPKSRRLDGTIAKAGRGFRVDKVDPASDHHKNLKQQWRIDAGELKRKFDESGSFRHESDYAAAMLHNGEVEKALAVFERLAREYPEEYTIASNLGTAYELNGDNRNALKWITRAMEIHPESHEGTEWLHIRILEAKIALEDDPDWLASNRIVGVDFGSGRIPEWPKSIRDSKVKQDRLLSALVYQLSERVQFVKPKDPVVTQLLIDLANSVGLRYSAKDAGDVLRIAGRYAEADLAGSIEERVKVFDAHSDSGSFGVVRRNPVAFALLLSILAALLAVLAGKRIGEMRDTAG